MKILDYCYFPGIRLRSNIVHNISQKCNALGSKTTFTRIRFEINFLEFLKDQSNVTQVFILGPTMYVDVINKHFHKLVNPFLEYVSHGPWECTIGVFQSEWHNIPLIETWFGDHYCFLKSSRNMGICQNPNYISRAENHSECPNWFKTSLINGMGKKSRLV